MIFDFGIRESAGQLSKTAEKFFVVSHENLDVEMSRCRIATSFSYGCFLGVTVAVLSARPVRNETTIAVRVALFKKSADCAVTVRWAQTVATLCRGPIRRCRGVIFQIRSFGTGDCLLEC